MTDRSYEQLSALLDDAVLDARERDQHLDSLLSDTEAQRAWGRYALIGRIMKDEAPTSAPVDISALVAADIAQEPKPTNVVQGRFGEARLVARADMRAGQVADGPAAITEDETTIIVPAGRRAIRQPDGCIELVTKGDAR